MDKEALFHQLESSIANNDKKLFIDIIFDLPADVIVGFTKEEFSQVLSISRQIDLHNVDDLFSFLLSEGAFYLKKVLDGIDELNNSFLSRFYYSLFISLSGNDKQKLKYALINSTFAYFKLAELGVDSRENLETVICFSRDARRIFSKTSTDYAVALVNEGSARKTLAEMGIDSRENFENSIRLYEHAQKIFSKTSVEYAGALMNEGNTRARLAEMGINSRKNLENAVSLYEAAREILFKKSSDYALSLMNESSARQKLADMGVNTRKNLETAIIISKNAQGIFSNKSAYYALTLVNEGSARARLGEIGTDSRENFEKSKELYLKSVSVLEKLGDGWAYSTALLNLNSLLKDNFYKTGEKKYLEEWEKNLGDIEKKIKDRDIKYKELLMAKIHEINASLLEFGGKLGINKASREYNKAYDLSKDPFYKFMDDFCQARTNLKSFCELVSSWKEIEKKGIFLDYYDYAVFECHLENALESTINEEDELKLAVEKLKEIRDRTQIKIIKDRVSAYIHLLQALVDCFNNDSYKEAAENVKEGCKIFREYEDKQGQQMCEIFHNAIVRKNPDAWQEIIRNREFSSNFYSLLCQYSDRKRAALEYYRFDQVHEIMGAVSKEVEQVKKISIQYKNKIDEIKNDLEDIKEKIDYVIISLKPGIKEEVEISVGAEYLGTGAKHIITISLQEISYPELKEDLEKIAGNRINKISDIPTTLANKVKTYLLFHGRENILEKLA